ncbi:MAG: hypothetical protein QXT13_10010 [Pyrobaculum sp.]
MLLPRVIALLILLLLTAAFTYSQETLPIYPMIIGPPPSTGIDVYIADVYGNRRTELYLGESFYLVIDLRPLSGYFTLVISMRGPFGSRTVEGGAYGGYVYGLPMRVTEPIAEGGVYTFDVFVYQDNVLVARGSAQVTERRCSPATVSIDSWSKFILGAGGQVTISVSNRGERDETYLIEFTSAAGSIRRTTYRLTVERGRTRTVTYSLPVDRVPERGVDTLRVRVYCGDGAGLRAEASTSVEVIPPRPGPLKIFSNVTEARLGESRIIELDVFNEGWDAEVTSVTFSEGRFEIVETSTIPRGGSGKIKVLYTPTRAGEYEVSITIRYRIPPGQPGSDRVYEDTASIRLRVYARLAVEAVDQFGRSVDVQFNIGGQRGREAWLLPGNYTVEAPQRVDLGENSRLVFIAWGDGGASPTRVVALSTNTVLRVTYVREHRVVVDLTPAFGTESYWVAEGDTFRFTIPGYREFREGSRYALRSYTIGNTRRDATGDTAVSVTVTSPLTITTQWAIEHRVEVNCGAEAYLRCVDGANAIAKWVEEGGVFTATLATYVYRDQRTRWRLEGSPEVRIIVTQPTTVRPSYKKQYFVNFGYAVATARGVVERVTLTGDWYDEGTTISVDPNRLTPPPQPQVDYRLERVEIDGAAAGHSFVVSKPHDVYVVWSKWYYVTVYSSVGRVRGEGWYLAESRAVVEVERPVEGFLVLDKFVKWVDDRGVEYRDPTAVVYVDRPVTIHAVWEKDYSQAAALAVATGVGGFFAWRRDYLYTITRTLRRRDTTSRKKLEVAEVAKKKTLDVEVVEISDETKTRGESEKDQSRA